MKKIKILLTASSELEADRKDFEIFIAHQNEIWVNQGTYFELIIWENFLDTMSQDQYITSIGECDIFVMLIGTKVREYTQEEFEIAFEKFKKTKKPFIFTYFKGMNLSLEEVDMKEVDNLIKFQKRLIKLEYLSTYKSIEGLQEHFGNQLNKLVVQNHLLKRPKPSKTGSKKTGTTVNDKVYQDVAKDTVNLTFDDVNKEKSFYSRGAISYEISDEMLLEQMYRCIIRISPDEKLLIKKASPISKLESIKISEVMEVELLEISNDDAFLVNSICSKEQVIEKDDFTEWLFDVTPQKVGNYSLILRVSVIKVINNKERKKQLVFDKKIIVKSEGVIPKSEGFREISEFDDTFNSSQKEITVFISYNHKDKEIADKLSSALKSAGMKVILDREKMKVGGYIQQFIQESIKNSDVTLSLVSNNSLLSGWVATETISTFYHENVSDKKFIACYTDEDFFNKRFRLDATRNINAKIDELDSLIDEYRKEKIDSLDLNNEKTRLFELRNNLGKILQRLKASLCIDIKENVFDENMKRIIEAIGSNK